jgi:hypothetical protein
MEANWIIEHLERKADNGFVVKVHWRYVVKDEDDEGRNYTANTYGLINYTQNDENYIPFEELTKEIVVGWVEETLGEDRLNEIVKMLEETIQTQKNPSTLGGIPWGGEDDIDDIHNN